MKLFKVNYDGLWLGGVAIVFADNADEAIAFVECHKASENFKDAKAVEIPAAGVVYNDSGDY